MKTQNMTMDIMEHLVWIIEITAIEFFNGDKTKAYDTLKESGLYDIYIDHYETTHTLSREYLLNEIREHFTTNGVDFAC